MALELPKLGKKKDAAVAGVPKNDLFIKLMSFFEKNPFMKIVIPAILLLLIVAIFLVVEFSDGILTGKDDENTSATTQVSNEVQLLPGNNIIKDMEVVELIKEDPLSQDILASAAYKGSVGGNSGMKTALIQIGDKNETLVLCEGETIGESSWELIEIADSYVIFKAGEITKKLNLA